MSTPARPLVQRLARVVPAIRHLHDARDALAAERDRLQAGAASLRAERDAARDDAREARGEAESARAKAESAADEAKAVRAAAMFWAYDTVLDVPGIVQRHIDPARRARPGLVTNFLGVAIPPKILPSVLTDRAGTLEAVPNPTNWHADLAEWAGALRAVDLARDRFVMIELGCGWGCWMNNTGAAARRAGLPVHLIGIEGDPNYLAIAQETLATNGFAAAEITLHRGVAAAEEGWALFPRQGVDQRSYGLEPVFGATDAQRADTLAAGTHDVLDMVPLERAAAPFARIDLLHVDIQGGEAALLRACLDVLQRKVAYLVVGTHSRLIEGELRDLMQGAGWRLEIDRTAIYNLAKTPPELIVDGVQAWRNPALTPAPGGSAPG